MTDWRQALSTMTAKYAVPNFTPTTLCDLCSNACGHCRWSKKGVQQPVPGWDAVRRDVPMQHTLSTEWVESYVVLDCPEFRLEERSRVYWDRFDAQGLREKALRGWEEQDG